MTTRWLTRRQPPLYDVDLRHSPSSPASPRHFSSRSFRPRITSDSSSSRTGSCNGRKQKQTFLCYSGKSFTSPRYRRSLEKSPKLAVLFEVPSLVRRRHGLTLALLRGRLPPRDSAPLRRAEGAKTLTAGRAHGLHDPAVDQQRPWCPRARASRHQPDTCGRREKMARHTNRVRVGCE
jgi:hypothetical protein